MKLFSSINGDYILSSEAKGKTQSNCALSARQPGRALRGEDHLLSPGGGTGSMGERERDFAIIRDYFLFDHLSGALL